MIENIMRDYLIQKLDVPVFMQRPESVPESYVILEKTGSTKRNHILTATIALQSYGPRLIDAARLNEEVKAAVEASPEMDEIGSVRLNSDYNFTNPSTKQYRYQAVFLITFYEEGLS